MDEDLDSLAQQYALKRNIKLGERLGFGIQFFTRRTFEPIVRTAWLYPITTRDLKFLRIDGSQSRGYSVQDAMRTPQSAPAATVFCGRRGSRRYSYSAVSTRRLTGWPLMSPSTISGTSAAVTRP